MYGVNTEPVNRLPKTTTTPQSSISKQVGNTVVQAVVLVAVIKLVDVLVEIAMSRFRKPKQNPST